MLSFIEQEEESLILDNGSAYVAVHLVIVNRCRLALAGCLAIVGVVVGEIVVGVAEAVVIDPSCASVPSIRTAFHVHKYRSSTLHTEFGRGGLLHR